MMPLVSERLQKDGGRVSRRGFNVNATISDKINKERDSPHNPWSHAFALYLFGRARWKIAMWTIGLRSISRGYTRRISMAGWVSGCSLVRLIKTIIQPNQNATDSVRNKGHLENLAAKAVQSGILLVL